MLASVPGLDRGRILFTPNFAPRDEYAWALEQGVRANASIICHALREWGELFRGREVFVRIDTGTGRGHHHHVRTAGAHAKFGVPVGQLDELSALTERHGVSVVGLHAHAGSGIFDADNWAEVATRLLDLAQRFPQLHAIDVGGGLGVPDGHDQLALDLAKLDTALLAVRQSIRAWRCGVDRAGTLPGGGGRRAASAGDADQGEG